MRRTLLGVGLGLGLRLLLIALVAPSLDVLNFEASARIFARGGNIFAEQYYWNYSPALGLLIAPLTALPPPYALAHRLLLTGFEAATALAIGRWKGRSTALAYWLNPATALLVATPGQFEMAALLPLVLACWCLDWAQRRSASSTSARRWC